VIEGDLEKCFDSIPHGVILNCLRKRIKDERFIDLIRQMLKAGVMEEGSFLPTYSGTPQGGLASPILRNIVLPEFDCWLEDQWQVNPSPLSRKQQYAHAMRNERRTRREQREIKMCLVEKKEATTFSQGGTYEQYRRWISAYPDLFRIQPLNAFVVRRSRGDDGTSSQARHSEQDH
jgi:RNA-directed DNA polymerase